VILVCLEVKNFKPKHEKKGKEKEGGKKMGGGEKRSFSQKGKTPR